VPTEPAGNETLITISVFQVLRLLQHFYTQ